MKKGTLIIGVVVLVLLVLFLWWKNTYNTLVQKDENVKAQLGQLNNVYQQRADLIPNLNEVVKGSAEEERATFTAVADARSKASSIQLTPQALNDPQAFAKFQQVQGELSNAISRLLVVSEQYPELKSQENFSQFMRQIEGQERRIQVERQRYNDVVNDYNRSVRAWPTSVIANMQGFQIYPYFEAAAGAENAPKVSFGTPGATPAPAAGTNPNVNPPSTSAPPAPNTQPHGAVRPAPAK